MAEIDRATLKRWAKAIVNEVEPDDAFVIEDNFDALLDEWHAARSQDEGRFIGGPEVAAFAGVVGPFLLGFFGDVAKDVVKDQSKKLLGLLIDKFLARRSSADEATRLHRELEAAIAKSRFAPTQKEVLRRGFDDLFTRVGTV